MLKKKIILLPLVALLLTGCAINASATWWNPTTWFTKTTETPVVSSSETINPEGKKVTNIGFQVKEAFGQTGEKTVTLTITPANAIIGNLTWSVDKPQVTITPSTDKKSAKVVVDYYFKDYATISVHESFSDITATGKVYSYGAYGIPSVNGTAYDQILDATNSHLAITSTSSPLHATAQEKVMLNYDSLKTKTANFGYYGLEEAKTSERAKFHSTWTKTFEKVWIHMSFVGSYSPVILNQTTGVVYNANNLVRVDRNTSTSGEDVGNFSSIEVELVAGDNMILIAGRNHTLTTQTAITAADFDNGDLTGTKLAGAKNETFKFNGKSYATPLIITRGSAVQNLTVGDLEFYE